MVIKIGDKLPSLSFKVLAEDGPKDLAFNDIFADKKVVLFAVPGSFTPTCSQQHLPGFIELHDQIKEKGIDTIACLSVNDPFVMKAWAESSNASDKILMLADWDGSFTKEIGMTLDLSDPGLGVRSSRYSMLVDNGVLKILNDEKGADYTISSAQKMLESL
jgi:peroxiredoxin